MTANTDRIVITGLGWVTPLGHDLDTVWDALLRGASGVSQTTRFDAETFPTTFSAEVKRYDHADFVRHPELHRHVGLNTAFALGAAVQAWNQAGLEAFAESDKLDRDRLGIYLGAGEGTLDFEPYVATNLAGWDPGAQTVHGASWADAAKTAFDVFREAEQEPNMPLSHLALEFDARGPSSNCLTACAASTQAIGEAAAILRRGDADVMLTGGTHTMIHPLGVTGFNRLTALSNRNDDPTAASRPFSADRDGFVMGEGAGVLVLETEAHARARGAMILAEVAGYGSTADAYRITDIHPDGRGAALAMRQALTEASVDPADVHWIAAHGTGTQENDKIETRAIKSVFQLGDDPTAVPPVSSIKSMLGHLIAAAGAVQAIAAVLAIQRGAIPPTANLHTPAPELDLDYVPNQARRTRVDTVLSNSFGFGGQNDTLVIRRA
ncbi:MAG: beta-ketoacyl-[acyl-carrier-protein] synthase family protein [Planctomycetota bacterium]